MWSVARESSLLLNCLLRPKSNLFARLILRTWSLALDHLSWERWRKDKQICNPSHKRKLSATQLPPVETKITSVAKNNNAPDPDLTYEKLGCNPDWRVCNDQLYVCYMPEVWIGDQQWIVFSLVISTHEILNTSVWTILKFNYVVWFIRTHYNVNLEIQFTMSMRTTLTSNSYHFKYVWFISQLEGLESFIKIYNLSCCCIYNKRKRQSSKQSKHTTF